MRLPYSMSVHQPPIKDHELSIHIEVPVPLGKSIPTIDHYAALLLPFEIEDDHCRINQYGCVASEVSDSLCVVQTDEHHFSLLPGPEFSPRLYRGQPAFYKECLPSLFRKPIIPELANNRHDPPKNRRRVVNFVRDLLTGRLLCGAQFELQ